MIDKLSDLTKLAKQKNYRKRVALVEANEKEVLTAILRTEKEGFVSPILIGEEDKIKATISELNIEITKNVQFVNSQSSFESGQIGVDLIKEKKADILMKGSISSPIFLKAFLNKKTGLHRKSLISHCAIFEIPNYHKILIISDCAISIEPTLDEKMGIINNAIVVANSIGIEKPKIAILSANEKVSLKMQSGVEAAILAKMGDRGQFKAIIDGPLAFDVIISKKAAEIKKLNSEVAGDADIIIADSVNSGNAIYKTLLFCSDAISASLVMGLDVPVVLTSRADDLNTKYTSIVAATLI